MAVTAVETLVIGAGPCGLGAATRLHQLNQTSWLLVEQEEKPGGLAGTSTTKEGFLVDKGGHVVFSFFQYFDDLLQKAVGSYDDSDVWATHLRKSHIIAKEKGTLYKIPYPYQHNIGGLSEETRDRCVEGVIKRDQSGHPKNFRDWILHHFGTGIAESFMFPYNHKVWAHDLSTMSVDWVSARVADVDAYSVVKNSFDYKTKDNWGPNKIFRFPQRGGTGEIYQKIADLLPQEKIHYLKKVVSIDHQKKLCTLSDQSQIAYKNLVSTMPMDLLMKMIGLVPDTKILRHSSTHVILFGFQGENPNKDSCWMYFPDQDVSFYRATVFSNYGEFNVPHKATQYSIMLEIAESEKKLVSEPDTLQRESLQSCYDMGLVSEGSHLVSTFYKKYEYGYPTPTIGLEKYRSEIGADLRKLGIFSRGRFGAYLYQVSNQDHSVMQGVQVIDNILFGATETVLNCPDYVNSLYNQDYRFDISINPDK